MLSNMVDMALTAEEKEKRAQDFAPLAEGGPDYPYGLGICLDEVSLEKLGLEANCEIGDLIHLNAIGKVTGVNINSGESGHRCNINIQLMFIGVENESHEIEEETGEEAEPSLEKRGYLRYK